MSVTGVTGGCEPPCDVSAGNGTCSLEEQGSRLSSCLPSFPQHIRSHTFPYLGKFGKTKMLHVEVNLNFAFPQLYSFLSFKRCQFSEARSRVERKSNKGARRMVCETG